MSGGEWLFSAASVQASLPDKADVDRFSNALRHGTMRLGLYAPIGKDAQEPHLQDELYVIISGAGYFVKNGQRRAFKQHDVIFVEAGLEHRFVDFTDDFATWVIFWGPKGGEEHGPLHNRQEKSSL